VSSRTSAAPAGQDAASRKCRAGADDGIFRSAVTSAAGPVMLLKLGYQV